MRVIHCDGSPAAVSELDAALRTMLDGGEAVFPLGPGQSPPSVDPGPGQVVLTTSGSTGQPKRVQLSAEALRAAAAATHARLSGPGRWLLALPTQHIAGLQVLIRAAFADTRAVALDLRSGFDTAQFGAAAREVAARRGHLARQGYPVQRCYTALAPTQLARLLAGDPGSLTCFHAVLVGGAAAPADLVRRARMAGVAVVTTYGMTETAGGCVYDGWPLEGTQVRVSTTTQARWAARQEEPASVESGDTGRIEIAGPMLASGYLDDPAQTAAAFREGWFVTSDIGQVDRRGRLRVLGRADDVIVTGGVNVAPAEVEAVLTGLPGVAQACVVGLPDPEWGERVAAAVVPADPARPPDPATVRAAARDLLSGAQAPKEVIVVTELPLLGVGKPDRGALRTRLATAPERGTSP